MDSLWSWEKTQSSHFTSPELSHRAVQSGFKFMLHRPSLFTARIVVTFLLLMRSNNHPEESTRVLPEVRGKPSSFHSTETDTGLSRTALGEAVREGAQGGCPGLLTQEKHCLLSIRVSLRRWKSNIQFLHYLQ